MADYRRSRCFSVLEKKLFDECGRATCGRAEGCLDGGVSEIHDAMKLCRLRWKY